MFFRQILDDSLAQYSYLIGCQKTGEALVIDPERDIDRYIMLAAEEGLEITAVAETHIHADFLSGIREFAERYEVRAYLSNEGGDDWRYTWPARGTYDVTWLQDGDSFRVGNVRVKAQHTPGHTPEHMSFLISDLGAGADRPIGLASGDFVFVGALGRPDLLETAAGQAGSGEPAARALYDSVQRFLEMDDYLQVWPGHGAGSACGKALGSIPSTTVGYEKQVNISLAAAQHGESEFVRHILNGQPEPPLYFARMKRLNKEGPPSLGEIPRPRRISSSQLSSLSDRTDIAVVDARMDRSAFMKAHLPASLYAAPGKNFPTIVASFVEPLVPVYLIIEERHLEKAVRSLIRVGVDDVRGYATPDALEEIGRRRERLASIEEISIDNLDRRRRDGRTAIIDVRRTEEYVAGHVPGAHLAPHDRLPEMRNVLPRDRTLLVHCRTGNRSASGAALLKRFGFDVVYVNGLFNSGRQAG